MSRDLSASFQAALAGDILYPLFFFEAEFASGTIRLWTGFGDRVWNGKTWSGVGWAIGLSEVQETTETRATSWTLGVKATPGLVAIALSEFRRNKPITVWLGLLDSSRALISDPAVWFSGLADISLVTVDPANPKVEIRYKSRIADLTRARVRRQTHEDQQIDYPGDRFYEYVGPLSDAVINWGG